VYLCQKGKSSIEYITHASLPFLSYKLSKYTGVLSPSEGSIKEFDNEVTNFGLRRPSWGWGKSAT